MNENNENLFKAIESARFAEKDLLAYYKTAEPLARLVALQILKKLREVQQDLNELEVAVFKEENPAARKDSNG